MIFTMSRRSATRSRSSIAVVWPPRATLGELRHDGDGEQVFVEAENLGDDVLAGLVSDGIASTYRRVANDRAIIHCVNGARKRLLPELVKRGVEVREIAQHRQTLEETFMKIVAGES